MRRLLGVAFEVANAALYIVGETFICPIWDKFWGYDFDAYAAALQAERYRAAEGL